MNRAAPEHVSDVERGRAAYQRRDWRDAHEALTRADADARLGPDDLERLAWSAGLAARDEDTLRLWEPA